MLPNPFGGGNNSSGGILNKQQDNITTSNTTTFGAQEGAFAFTSAGGAVNISDPRTIEQAFKFASESLGLLERTAGATQKSFENALGQTLATSDAERTGGSQRVLILAGLALAALVGFAYLVKS